MAFIKASNVDLAIPILGKTDRLFHTSNYSDSLVGSEKKIEDTSIIYLGKTINGNGEATFE